MNRTCYRQKYGKEVKQDNCAHKKSQQRKQKDQRQQEKLDAAAEVGVVSIAQTDHLRHAIITYR